MTSGTTLEPEQPTSWAQAKGSEQEEDSKQEFMQEVMPEVLARMKRRLELELDRVIEQTIVKKVEKMMKEERAKKTIATSSMPPPERKTPIILSTLDSSIPLDSTYTDEPGQRNVIYLEPVTTQTVLSMTRRFGVPTFVHIHETTGFAHIYFRTHQEAQDCVDELPSAQWMRGYIVTEDMKLMEEDMVDLMDETDG
jgi:hypothetical protein